MALKWIRPALIIPHLRCAKVAVMMGHREPMKGGNEYDFLTGWRRYRCRRAGDARSAKMSFNRRVRREAREEAKKALEGHISFSASLPPDVQRNMAVPCLEVLPDPAKMKVTILHVLVEQDLDEEDFEIISGPAW